MDPVSESLIGQILDPVGMAATAPLSTAEARVTLEEIVTPRYPAGAYTGPERRAQGHLIAEILSVEPVLPGQPPEADGER